MSSIMSQAWKIVKPHIPLIRFRKGGPDVAVNSSPTVAATTINTKRGPQLQQRSVIEDFQLPTRYKRLALDEKEIDAINSGGAY